LEGSPIRVSRCAPLLTFGPRVAMACAGRWRWYCCSSSFGRRPWMSVGGSLVCQFFRIYHGRRTRGGNQHPEL
jgi:hypothetical protein